LPAIGALLSEAVVQVVGLYHCGPFGNAGFGKLSTQRLDLLLGMIDAAAFVLELLAQRRHSGLDDPPDIRDIIRGRIMGRSPGAVTPSRLPSP
jgi:hypothetical protein